MILVIQIQSNNKVKSKCNHNSTDYLDLGKKKGNLTKAAF